MRPHVPTPIRAVGRLALRAAWAGVTALCLLLLLLGCSQTRTVTVPAGETSVHQVAPDTIDMQELPPVEPKGEFTLAEEVIVYEDTADFAVEVSMVEVDRSDPDDQSVTVRTKAGNETIEKTFALPPMGESLRGRADGREDGMDWSVSGAPTDWTVDAYVTSTPPWWRRALQNVQAIVAFAVGALVGYVATKLLPGL